MLILKIAKQKERAALKNLNVYLLVCPGIINASRQGKRKLSAAGKFLVNFKYMDNNILKMKSKKGIEDPVRLILGITLLFGLFFSTTCWLTDGFGSVVGTSDAISTSQLIKSCETLEKKYVSGPVKAVCYNCDYDEDGLKDFCDNCPLQHNYLNPQKLDLDKDLFVQNCCGNDGNLEWLDDKNNPENKWGKILDPKSLPCSHPQAKDGTKKGRG